MNQSNWKMITSLKRHQYNTFLIVTGIFIGACLHYFFNKSNMDYVAKQNYNQGRIDEKESIIRDLLAADTIDITENELICKYRQK